MTDRPTIIIETMTTDGEELALTYEIRRLPYLRSSEIQQGALAALERAGVLQTISAAIGTASRAVKLELPDEGDAEGASRISGILKRWLSGQDMSAIVDGLREVISDHVMPAARTLPVVTRAACDAAVCILDNRANYKAHRKALKLEEPETRRGFYVESADLRDHLRESIRPDQAIDVIIEWLTVEKARDTLGKLLPIAKLTMGADEGEAATKG